MAKEAIYIVEDEPLISRVVQVNLEHAGYETSIARDGVEAFDALQPVRVAPNLILLDLTLPYMDGFELLSRLKASSALASIPVIIMTARSHDKDIQVAHSIGAARYLTKPINPSELVKTVEAVLAESRPAEPDGVVEQ